MKIRLLFFLTLFFSYNNIVLSKQTINLGGINNSINHKIAAAILTEAYKNININVKFTLLPAKRSLVLVNKGLLDGETQRIKTINNKYQNLVIIPVPLFELVGAAFTKSTTISLKNKKLPTGHKIAIRRGVKYAEDLTRGLNPIITDSEKQLIKLLHSKRVDIIISNPYIIDFYLKKMKAEKIQILKPILVNKSLYHFLHSSNHKLLPKITKSLKKMKRTGRLKKIYKQVLAENLK